MKKLLFFILALILVAKINYINAIYYSGEEITRNVDVNMDKILGRCRTRIEECRGLNDVIKSLYRSNYFSEINVLVTKNKKVKISIKEKSVVKKISLYGNKGVNKYVIVENFVTKIGNYYSYSVLKQDIEKVRTIYRKLGYFFIRVHADVVMREKKYAEIIIRIIEKKRMIVNKIYFRGNKCFSNVELKRIILSKESICKNFFFSNFYFPYQMLADIKLLQSFYFDNGFVDFKILSSGFRKLYNSEFINISYNLQEGKKYNIESIIIVNNNRLIKELIEEKKYYFRKKVDYNHKQIKEILILCAKIIRKNFPGSYMKLKIKKNLNDKKITIKISTNKARDIKIRNINIDSKNKDSDRIIRKSLFIREGEKHNYVKLFDTRKIISQLNFLDYIILNPNQKDLKKIDLNIKIKEKYTGLLKTSIGYQSINGVTGQFTLQENNLFKTGKILNINLYPSKKDFSLSVNFTDPGFNNGNLTYSADLISKYYRRTRDDNKSEKESTFNLKLGYNISKNIYHDIYFSIQSGSTDIMKYRKNRKQIFIGHTIQYDNTDKKFVPKKKYTVKFNQKVFKNGYKISYYYNNRELTMHNKIDNKILLKVNSKKSYIKILDRNIDTDHISNLEEEYIRGFSKILVNKKVKKYNMNEEKFENVEKEFFITNIEMSFPIKNINNIKGSIFSDLGTLSSKNLIRNMKENISKSSSKKNIRTIKINCNKKNPFHKDYQNRSKKIRISLGAGIIFNSSLGVIKLDYGFPIRKESFDRISKLRFSIGTVF